MLILKKQFSKLKIGGNIEANIVAFIIVLVFCLILVYVPLNSEWNKIDNMLFDTILKQLYYMYRGIMLDLFFLAFLLGMSRAFSKIKGSMSTLGFVNKVVYSIVVFCKFFIFEFTFIGFIAFLTEFMVVLIDPLVLVLSPGSGINLEAVFYLRNIPYSFFTFQSDLVLPFAVIAAIFGCLAFLGISFGHLFYRKENQQ